MYILLFVSPSDLYSLELTSLVLYDMVGRNCLEVNAEHAKERPWRRRRTSSETSNKKRLFSNEPATLTRYGCSVHHSLSNILFLIEEPDVVRTKYSTGRVPPFVEQEDLELFSHQVKCLGRSSGQITAEKGRFWNSFCKMPATVPCLPSISIDMGGRINILQVVARDGHAVTVTDIAFALCHKSVSAPDSVFLLPTSAGTAVAGSEWAGGSNFVFNETWSQRQAYYCANADCSGAGNNISAWIEPSLEDGNPRDGLWPHCELSITGIYEYKKSAIEMIDGITT